ncbi:MAG TPA: hypothetical protein VHI98_13140 [Vicinamibacterales bacterium]|nr:hypothetical protein [Vicinamibacterales bacterium]HEX2462489.1 hypothetical protein [Vicinamibacterales bacterium]
MQRLRTLQRLQGPILFHARAPVLESDRHRDWQQFHLILVNPVERPYRDEPFDDPGLRVLRDQNERNVGRILLEQVQSAQRNAGVERATGDHGIVGDLMESFQVIRDVHDDIRRDVKVRLSESSQAELPFCCVVAHEQEVSDTVGTGGAPPSAGMRPVACGWGRYELIAARCAKQHRPPDGAAGTLRGDRASGSRPGPDRADDNPLLRIGTAPVSAA